MYRWPLSLFRGVDSSDWEWPSSRWDACSVELSPRAAPFSLAALARGGDAVELVSIDRHIKAAGASRPAQEQWRQMGALAASLIAPMVVAYELGRDDLDLTNLTLLPLCDVPRGRAPRFVVTGDSLAVWATPLGMLQPGLVQASIPVPIAPESWVEIEVELPRWRTNALPAGTPEAFALGAAALIERRGVGVCLGDVRVAGAGVLRDAPAFWPPPPALMRALRAGALGASARSPSLVARSVDALRMLVDDLADTSDPTQRHRVLALYVGAVLEARRLRVRLDIPCREAFERHEHDVEDLEFGVGCGRPPNQPPPTYPANWDDFDPVDDLGALAIDDVSEALGRSAPTPRFMTGLIRHDALTIDVALAPEADGVATLALLPPVEEGPIPNLVERMEAATRTVLRTLMGMPFAEERKEAIEHRLVGPERTTTLLVGWSLVLPRNRRVFATWLGSDGRVVIRLFPPDGQKARGRM